MQSMNIKEYKIKLRQQYKEMRRMLQPEKKKELDAAILRRITSTYQYRDCETLYCYVSTAIEVDTLELINHALQEGKKVAVPRCIDGTPLMDFYYIRSLEDLERRTFGVLEPIASQCEKVEDFSGKSICIIPGLSFDQRGFRLGYGKGYYDRFLCSYHGVKIGICYHNCIQNRLPNGRFDVPVDLLITERYLRVIGKNNGQRR